MSCIDFRKLTERRFVFGSVIIAALSLLVSGVSAYWSYSANNFVKKNFCYEKGTNHLSDLKLLVDELPKLLSGCALVPSEYCKDARSRTSSALNSNFEMMNLLLVEDSAFQTFAKINQILSATEKTLRGSNGERETKLVTYADELIKARSSLRSLDTLKFSCRTP